MQNSLETQSRGLNVFDKKLEDIPGGVTIAISEVTQTVIKAGTPVGKDTNGLFHVVKTAKAQANATNSATDYRVEKGHNFKVGNILASGTSLKAYAITAITTTETAYDTISLGTTLGVAVTAGDVYISALAESNSTGSAFKYTPFGLTGTEIDVTSGDNHLVDVIVRGSVIESLIPPIHSAIKSALPLIRFV